MIHRPDSQSPSVVNIVFTLFCFARCGKVGIDRWTAGHVYRQHVQKTMIPTGRDCGLAEWINFQVKDVID